MTLQLPSVRLQALLDRLVTRRGIHHAVLAVETIDGSARWVGAAGRADRLDTPMRPETPYFIASVDKLYTAAAILKLHEQGRIALDRPAAAYLPAELMRGIHALGAVDCSARITVRHLLSHTSGLADWLLDRPTGGRSMMDRIVSGAHGVSLDTAHVLRTVRDDLTPYFPPQDCGAGRIRTRYSDTNFLLLIAIIEAVCARPLHEVFDEWIFAPSGMRHTCFIGVSQPAAPTPSPAHLWVGNETPDLGVSLTALRSICSTVADQVASLRALLTGRLFANAATLRLMQQPWRRFGMPLDRAALQAPGWPIEYGLGMMRFALPRAFAPLRPFPAVIGHTGSTGSWLFCCPAWNLLFAGTVDQATAGALPFRTVVPGVLRLVAEANNADPASPR